MNEWQILECDIYIYSETTQPMVSWSTANDLIHDFYMQFLGQEIDLKNLI